MSQEVTIRHKSRADSSFMMDRVANDPRRQARPERRLMTKRLLAFGFAVIGFFMFSALGQTAGQSPSAPTQASPQRALLDRYCVSCHSQRARAAGQDSARKLTLDDLDPARVSDHPDTWELVVR